MTDNFTVIEGEKARIASIKNDTLGIFEIKNNPNADPRWHEGFAIHAYGRNTVLKYEDIIEHEAKLQGVNPDWVKSIAYLENSQGTIKDNYLAPLIGHEITSLLPMNVRPKLWGGIGGVEGDKFSDPAQNIKAGVAIIKGIQERLLPEDQSLEKVASIWNRTKTEYVTDFGARAANIEEEKFWEHRGVKPLDVGTVFLGTTIDGYYTRDTISETVIDAYKEGRERVFGKPDIPIDWKAEAYEQSTFYTGDPEPLALKDSMKAEDRQTRGLGYDPEDMVAPVSLEQAQEYTQARQRGLNPEISPADDPILGGYDEGQSPAEIAAALGTQSGTIYGQGPDAGLSLTPEEQAIESSAAYARVAGPLQTMSEGGTVDPLSRKEMMGTLTDPQVGKSVVFVADQRYPTEMNDLRTEANEHARQQEFLKNYEREQSMRPQDGMPLPDSLDPAKMMMRGPGMNIGMGTSGL